MLSKEFLDERILILRKRSEVQGSTFRVRDRDKIEDPKFDHRFRVHHSGLPMVSGQIR